MANKLIRKGKLHSRYQLSNDRWREGCNVPWLNIRGKWLARLGFNIGDPIEIVAENGVLTIKKVVSDGDR